MEKRSYYEAYDLRYRTAHEAGVRWFGEAASPIVGQIIEQYGICPQQKLLELGCGEGRDAIPLLRSGFDLLATDLSEEAIRYCRELAPDHGEHFQILDCVRGKLEGHFDFIYGVAVVHMLLKDGDRDGFYRFVRNHLTDEGVALICSMGDGKTQFQSDEKTAFALQERTCQGKTLLVAGTSCRMVTQEQFAWELTRNGLNILQMGITAIPEQFPEMLYAVVKRTV